MQPLTKTAKWIIGIVCLLVVGGIIAGVTVFFVTRSDKKDFKDDFKWGSATSSYQIEGAWDKDGKVESIWDHAVHNHPEAIFGRDTGDVAADSYNLYKEDVKAMKSIGLQFYRFSISWPRIIPSGGTPNPLGIKYYNDLIDELIANGIEPMVTIYHWDLPQYLQDLGGWTSSKIIDHFEHYVDVLYENFGDRVKQWITFNEPHVFCTLGYGAGIHAPLIVSPGLGEYECGHNVLLSHAKAYNLYKTKYFEKQQGKVGICYNAAFFYPGDNKDLAETAQEFNLGWYAHPIFTKEGDYPKVMKDNVKANSEKEGRPKSRLPEFTEDEKKSLIGSADFLALNYYSSRIADTMKYPPNEYNWEADAGITQEVDPSWKRAKSDFLFIVPDGLHKLLVWIKDHYNNPSVVIAENGYSDDGQTDDYDRISYMKEHFTSVKKAMDDGCNIEAYTMWSLLDNFEWARGYSEKFGIFKINFESDKKERIPKKSSEYFRDVIKERKILDVDLSEALDFTYDFQFGSATSSYQIEGAWDADGKVENIWDRAVHNSPDAIFGRDTGDVAADSYRLYREDVKAMKTIGLQFYRFSISWARIISSDGTPNPLGIAYYNNLINELIANGIEPMVTIYHWDLPQYLQDLGGWRSSMIVEHFEHYADVLYDSFGDRVKQWITFNEPHVFCTLGYGNGVHAPLIVSPGLGEYECGHNVLLSHAKAYHLYKNKYAAKQQGKVGYCMNTSFFYPGANETQSLADVAMEFNLGWFANPIYSKDGDYPKVMRDNVKANSEKEGRSTSRLPSFTADEIKMIQGSADFFALNYYSSRIVYKMQNPPAQYDWEADAGIRQVVDPEWKRGKSDFLYVVPDGLHKLLVWIKEKYDNPVVVIAENGYSDDGQIVDDERISYIKDHLTAVKSAINDGCNVKAYTVWSLLDNFEWARGYSEKFGIVGVNFTSPNKERIPKKSSEYFGNVIKARKVLENK